MTLPRNTLRFDKRDPERSFNELQNRMQDVVDVVNRVPFAFGEMVEGGDFAPGEVKVLRHGLGAEPGGVLMALQMTGFGSFVLLEVSFDSVTIQSQNVATNTHFWVYP